LLHFKSGTTGTPKGVIKNQFKLVNNVQVSAQMSKSKAKIIKCFTPLAYHGVAMLSIIEQIFNENLCLVFPSKKLDLIDILESIETYKCNSIIAFPKILNNLLDHPNFHNYDLSSIESVACSGQLPPAELILKSKEMIPNAKNFTVVYGATELNKLLSNTLNLKDFNPETYQNCVGQLVPFAECKIVDPETGRLVPLNAEGELHVRTFSLTSGYYDDEEKTRTVIDKNKWYIILILRNMRIEVR
jgi:fatty-acyl-CoA synthase